MHVGKTSSTLKLWLHVGNRKKCDLKQYYSYTLVTFYYYHFYNTLI